MGVEISKGGLNFNSNLDPSGFEAGALKIKKSIASLTIQLQSYRNVAKNSLDPKVISEFNKKAKETEEEIKRLKSLGLDGFDHLGNKIEETTKKAGGFSGALSKIWGGLRFIANILPGLGIGGVLAFAIEPLQEWIFGLTEAEKAQKRLNEAIQEMAREEAKALAEAELYITKLQDTNISLDTRQKLLDEFILKSPNVLGALNLQNVATERGKEILDGYIYSLRQKIQLQSLEKQYSDSFQREADLSSGKLSEETDLSTTDKALIHIGGILSFGDRKEVEQEIEAINVTRRRDAANAEKVYREGIEQQIKAIVEGGQALGDAEDSSLKALERRLTVVNERLRNLQKGESSKNLLSERASLEAQIKQREKLLGFDKKVSTASKIQRISGVNPLETRDAFEQLQQASTEFSEQQRKDEAKRYSELLKDFYTYTEKRLAIQQKYGAIEGQLLLKGDFNNAAVAREKQEEELTALDVANVMKWDSYKQLFENIEKGSKQQTQVAIAEFEKQLAAANITAEARIEIEKKLNALKGNIDKKGGNGLKDAAEQLQRIATQFNLMEGSVGNVAKTLVNAAASYAEIRSGIESFNNSESASGQIVSGLGIVGAGFGLVKSIVSLFDKSDEKRAKAEAQRAYAQELQIKAIEAQSMAMERQLALIKDIYGTERLEKYGDAIKELNTKISDSASGVIGKYTLSGNKDIDELIGRLNNGETINQIYESSNNAVAGAYYEKYKELQRLIEAGQVKKIGAYFDFYLDLDSLKKGTEEVEKLQKMIEDGQLDDVTRSKVQALIDSVEQYKEALRSLNEEVTGVGFDEVGNSLVELFARGNAAAEDFAKNFEDLMKKSILNSFKRNALEKQLEGFYDQFADYANSDGGLNENEISSLRSVYNAIITNSQKQFEDLQKATGIDFTSDTSANQTGLKGGTLREMTEQTGSELTGLFRAQFDITKKMQLDTVDVKMTAFEMMQIARQKLDYLNKIEQNTRWTVGRLDLAILELKGINLNTKPGQSGRDLGVGGGVI